MKSGPFLLAAGALVLGGCAATGPSAPSLTRQAADHPEARIYDTSHDANAAVDAALARAAERTVNVLLVLGANWCHDSRAFAGWMETPRFKTLTDAQYELVYVNVGIPQTGDGHNLDIASRFGVEDIKGTPTVLLLSWDGVLLNGDTAKSWRNTASRSENAIFDELALMATAQSIVD
ncbi:thioredoxin family protein [Pontixanthobacter sp.]|uniref:thioredoxin family protein n=1 Tax=Pontixanthobacter sp. TaxID=2792078 RepID=UPI003C7D0875